MRELSGVGVPTNWIFFWKDGVTVVAPDQLVVPTDQRKAIEKGEPGGYFPIKHTKIDTS